MTIQQDLAKLAPGAIVELYEIDSTAIGGDVTRLHAGTNELKSAVVWQGNTYTPFPIECQGWEFTGQGQLPRPKVRVSNTGGLLAAYTRAYQDLVGAKFTRKRTLVKYLDAVNFAGGVNPTADPGAYLADDVYFVDRKAAENKVFIEFELAAAFDVAGVQLPRRYIVQNVCPWKYRGAECSWTGTTYFDAQDQPVATPALDKCGKRLASCKARFGEFNQLPFGGFPAAGLFR